MQKTESNAAPWRHLLTLKSQRQAPFGNDTPWHRTVQCRCKSFECIIFYCGKARW
jgi:hypothetical protein